MPLFDFFKRKKKDTDQLKADPNPVKSPSQSQLPEEIADHDLKNEEAFVAFKPYNAYLIKCINLLMRGDYAPIAAYETPSGEVLGTLFLHTADDYQPDMGIPETLEKLRSNLDEKLATGEATSYLLFYHSRMLFNETIEPAETDAELGAVTAILYRKQTAPVYYNFKYGGDEKNLHFGAISPLSDDQVTELLNYQGDITGDLFTERIEVDQPRETLPNGIEVRRTTNGQTSDLWSGLRGFTTHRGDTTNQLVHEFSAAALTSPALFDQDGVSVHEYGEGPVAIRAIMQDKAFISSFPVYPFGPVVDVKTAKIDEWENSNQLEAIVKTQAKETFQLYFYATDYARNKSIYRSTASLKIRVSGVIYALDYREDKAPGESMPKFADDFAAFVPSGHAMEFGSYDFMTTIIKVEKITFTELADITGYILTFKMINMEDDPNFYTMEAFVNPENIRFDGPPKVGDKVSGAVQLMGEIWR